MARVACPYCYHPIESNRLHFRCLGIGAPGWSGCRPATDDDRLRETGFAGPTFRTFPAPRALRRPTRARCPDCHGETGARACPVCHTPLPSTFVGSASPLIGMVGGKGSGKTVYLTVLDHELRTRVRKRFDADVRLAGDQQGGMSTTAGYLERYEQALFGAGELLPQTEAAVDGRREPIVLQWRQPHRPHRRRPRFRTTTLSFYDTAGEDLATERSAESQRYLAAADGLIVLLDPWQLPTARDQLDVPKDAVTGVADPYQVLAATTEALRQAHGVRPSRRIRRPVAVAFAKMDALFGVLGRTGPLFDHVRAGDGYDETDGQSVHQCVADLLPRFGAENIDTLLRQNYDDFRYFAVSALGEQPDYASKEVHHGGVAPFRVEDPLLWLLHRRDVIARSRT